jgi:hypothetical protein
MINEQQKQELIDFVLTRVPVWLLNIAVKGFSTQTLYRRFKRELMSAYPTLMFGECSFGTVMAEVFSAYEVSQIEAPKMRHQIDVLRTETKMLKKLNAVQYYETVDRHNALVEEYAKLIQPQNDLIKRYKLIHNIK